MKDLSIRQFRSYFAKLLHPKCKYNQSYERDVFLPDPALNDKQNREDELEFEALQTQMAKEHNNIHELIIKARSKEKLSNANGKCIADEEHLALQKEKDERKGVLEKNKSNNEKVLDIFKENVLFQREMMKTLVDTLKFLAPAASNLHPSSVAPSASSIFPEDSVVPDQDSN